MMFHVVEWNKARDKFENLCESNQGRSRTMINAVLLTKNMIKTVCVSVRSTVKRDTLHTCSAVTLCGMIWNAMHNNTVSQSIQPSLAHKL